MSSQPAAERASEARTIGDILLARGFVNRDVLDEALARQQTSGKPLGQILVEEGAISRLELASALAEQWSDIGSVSPEFGHGATPSGLDSPLLELQELRLSRRMMEERLRAWEQSAQPREDSEERTRLLARLAGVEAAVAGLQEHDTADEVGRLRAAVEEISRRLDQTSTADSALAGEERLGTRIDDVDRRLSALGAAVERAFEEMQRRADESRDALASLSADVAAAPVADEALEARLAALASAVDELSRSVGQRPDHTDDIAEIRRRLDVLAGDGAVLAALQEQAADLEKRFERRAATFEGRFQDLFAASQASESLAHTVDELGRRVDALASRPVAKGKADARVAELSVRLDQLAAAVESLGDRPAGAPDVKERLDELALAVASLETRPTVDPALTARVEGLAGLVDEIASRSDPAADVRASVVDLGARVDELARREIRDPGAAERIDSLTERVQALELRPDADVPLHAMVASLAERADQLERGDGELVARVENLAELVRRADGGDPADALADVTGRLEGLERGAGALADELRRVGEMVSARDGELEARLESLSARLDDAPQARVPTSVSDALAGDGSPSGSGETEDVERLRMMVERLMHDFADHRRAVSSALSSREFTALLEELAARVDELAAGGVVAAPAGAEGGRPAEGRSDVRALTRRLDEVEESVRSSRDGVFQRLERMMGTIDWRLQRLEHPEQAEEAEEAE